MIYFTSDLHIGHNRCAIEFRSHQSLEQMHQLITDVWNNNINSLDSVYVLGDVFMGEWKSNVSLALKFLDQLNFDKMYVIPGNHDNLKVFNQISAINDKFIVLPHVYTKKFDRMRFVCSHYPLASWDGVSDGVSHLHGHCHGSKGKGRILDVGWDGYYTNGRGIWPIDVVERYMSIQDITSLDYH